MDSEVNISTNQKKLANVLQMSWYVRCGFSYLTSSKFKSITSTKAIKIKSPCYSIHIIISNWKCAQRTYPLAKTGHYLPAGGTATSGGGRVSKYQSIPKYKPQIAHKTWRGIPTTVIDPENSVDGTGSQPNLQTLVWITWQSIALCVLEDLPFSYPEITLCYNIRTICYIRYNINSCMQI